MNVFLPYESLEESARCLDDLRLNKQILECFQIMQVGLGSSKGYRNHPIVKHWAMSLKSLSKYALYCCIEYEKRRGYQHKYHESFMDCAMNDLFQDAKPLVYFCAEGSLGTPECIRTYDKEEVMKLYKQKLINKWLEDISKGREPKWTNSNPPDFWINLKED